MRKPDIRGFDRFFQGSPLDSFSCFRSRIILPFFLLLFVNIAGHCQANEPEILRIGRFAYSNPRYVLISHHPLMLFLAQQTGLRKVELSLYLTYEEVHTALLKGDLDLGWLGTAFYAVTEQKNYSPLVTPVWRGVPYYVGHIIVRSDSSFYQLTDLIGRSVAFVSESSSSGYIFPSLLLNKHGVALSKLREYAFLRSHDAVAYAVLTRQYDAGAAYKSILEQEMFRNEQDKFRVLGETDKIWNEPIVMRDTLPDALRSKLQAAFLSADCMNVLSSIDGLDGFVSISDTNYDGVRSLLLQNTSKNRKQKGWSD